MSAPTEMTFAPLLLLAVVGVVWYALNRALFGDVLSPFSLLFPGWVMPLIVQMMNLSMYERAWRLWPSLTVVWVTFALTGTCVLSAWLLPRDPARSRRHEYFRLVETPLRSTPFLLAFLGIYAVSFGAYLYAEFITNPIGIPLVAALQGRFTGGAFHRWGKDSPLAALSALLLILTPMAYAA